MAKRGGEKQGVDENKGYRNGGSRNAGVVMENYRNCDGGSWGEAWEGTSIISCLSQDGASLLTPILISRSPFSFLSYQILPYPCFPHPSGTQWLSFNVKMHIYLKGTFKMWKIVI